MKYKYMFEGKVIISQKSHKHKYCFVKCQYVVK